MSAQENKWVSVILDEVLTISMPEGFTQTDTTITDKATIAHSRIIQSNTGTCILFVSIDSVNIDLKVHDRESAYISLEGVGKGVCIQYSQAGYRCERNDTSIDKIPGKKFLFYENKTDLALFGYVFRANNKTYKIFSTVNNNVKDDLRPNDLNKLLSSIKFNTDNIKEYKFYSKSESPVPKTNFVSAKMIIPAMVVIALIVFIVIKLK
jgi:hypothetical protein